MKVVDKKLFFINSSERTTGDVHDFTIDIPSHLLTCLPTQRLRVVLNDVVLPYTWYNVQLTNDRFTVTETNAAGLSRTFQVRLVTGSYNAVQLTDELKRQLEFVSQAMGFARAYTVSFDEVTAKFKFECDLGDAVERTEFTFGVTPSCHKLLGFTANQSYSFNAIGELLSDHSISTMLTDALYINTDLLNTNVDKAAGEKTTFHLSSVFAKLPINTSPFNNIIFQNRNDDYIINLPNHRLIQLRIWLTTVEHNPIILNDDFSMTLKIEVLEDDEKVMLSQNTGIGELLKLLLLQQRVNKSSAE